MCPRSRGDAGLKKMGTYTWDVYLHLSICISISIYIYIYGGIMMYNVGKTRIYHLFMVIWGVVYSCFTHINDVCIVYTVLYGVGSLYD